MQSFPGMTTHLPDVVDHELAERRKAAIYFLVIAMATLLIAVALILVLR
jgi:hypothetical protein